MTVENCCKNFEQDIGEIIDQSLMRDLTGRETVICGYCRKSIEKEKALRSKEGFPYCSEYCMVMFTED